MPVILRIVLAVGKIAIGTSAAILIKDEVTNPASRDLVDNCRQIKNTIKNW